MEDILIRDIKKSTEPFEVFLREKHAEDYQGTDDDMVDNFEAWLDGLENGELIEYANEFGNVLTQYLK